MSEKDRMLRGDLYDPLDLQLAAERRRARLGSVIGAGSVVTKHIPAAVFAAGNPCRVIREIGEGSAAR